MFQLECSSFFQKNLLSLFLIEETLNQYIIYYTFFIKSLKEKDSKKQFDVHKKHKLIWQSTKESQKQIYKYFIKQNKKK
jgi:hypothetical protein